MSNFMKIRLLGTELFHAVGQRHKEANSRFSQFFKRASNQQKSKKKERRHNKINLIRTEN